MQDVFQLLGLLPHQPLRVEIILHQALVGQGNAAGGEHRCVFGKEILGRTLGRGLAEALEVGLGRRRRVAAEPVEMAEVREVVGREGFQFIVVSLGLLVLAREEACLLYTSPSPRDS